MEERGRGDNGGLLKTTEVDDLLELFEGKVRVLVVAEGVREALGVVLLNQIVIGGPVLEHGHEVVSGEGLDVVLGHPVEEFLLIVLPGLLEGAIGVGSGVKLSANDGKLLKENGDYKEDVGFGENGNKNTL